MDDVLRKIRLLLLVVMLAVSIFVGCGGDEDTIESEDSPAAFVSASPPSSSEIFEHASIVLTFDNPPTDLTISLESPIITRDLAILPIGVEGTGFLSVRTGYIKTASLSANGKIVFLDGRFPTGPFTLTLTWADGSITLNYTVPPICAPCAPRSIISHE